jgi:hypothetical protein
MYVCRDSSQVKEKNRVISHTTVTNIKKESSVLLTDQFEKCHPPF